MLLIVQNSLLIPGLILVDYVSQLSDLLTIR